MADIDLNAIEAEISQMSPEEIRKQLTALKTKQKVAQKKYYNPDTAKKARDKKAAEIAAMTERMKQLGLYDTILAEANAAADKELAEKEGEEVEVA